MDENLKRGTVLDDYMAFDEIAKNKPKNRKPAQMEQMPQNWKKQAHMDGKTV